MVSRYWVELGLGSALVVAAVFVAVFIVGYDQAIWVARLRHADDDPGDLVGLFEALRRSNLALWARFGATHGDRIGMHSERGPESYDLTFRLGAGHDRIHMAQARRALQALRGA